MLHQLAARAVIRDYEDGILSDSRLDHKVDQKLPSVQLTSIHTQSPLQSHLMIEVIKIEEWHKMWIEEGIRVFNINHTSIHSSIHFLIHNSKHTIPWFTPPSTPQFNPQSTPQYTTISIPQSTPEPTLQSIPLFTSVHTSIHHNPPWFTLAADL